MAIKALWFVANWSVAITAIIGVLWLCFEIASMFIESAVKHWNFYGVMIDWITHRKSFKEWMDSKRKTAS